MKAALLPSSCTLRPLQGLPNAFVVCFCLLTQQKNETKPNRSMKQKLLRVKLVMVSVFGSGEVCASKFKIFTRIKEVGLCLLLSRLFFLLLLDRLLAWFRRAHYRFNSRQGCKQSWATSPVLVWVFKPLSPLWPSPTQLGPYLESGSIASTSQIILGPVNYYH